MTDFIAKLLVIALAGLVISHIQMDSSIKQICFVMLAVAVVLLLLSFFFGIHLVGTF